MIRNSKQNWASGQRVKVGFMSLIVKAAIETPGDYAPDAYILSNLQGTQLYRFVPHIGLEKLSPDDAREMLNDQAKIDDAKRQAFAAEQAAREAVQAVFASSDAPRGWTVIEVGMEVV